MRTHNLIAGTALYHGTDSDVEFACPKGPAWFCLTREAAFKWAGWASPPAGHQRGPKRVLVCRLRCDLTLPAVVALKDWETLAERICGEPEPYVWTFADKVVAAGLPGWFGSREVMIAKPLEVLAAVSEG